MAGARNASSSGAASGEPPPSEGAPDAPTEADEAERVWELDSADAGLETGDVGSIVAAPLVTREGRYGVLLVGRGPEAEFGRRETAHVARLAQHLALKLERTGGRPYGE